MWQDQKNLFWTSVLYSKLLAISGNLLPVIHLIRLLTLFSFHERRRGTPWCGWEFIQCLSVPLYSLYHGKFNSAQISASTCGRWLLLAENQSDISDQSEPGKSTRLMSNAEKNLSSLFCWWIPNYIHLFASDKFGFHVSVWGFFYCLGPLVKNKVIVPSAVCLLEQRIPVH